MDGKKVHERILQKKDNGSYVITVPTRMVDILGVEAGQTIRFYGTNGKVMLKPLGRELTKKDIGEMDKYEAAMESIMEQSRSEKKTVRHGRRPAKKTAPPEEPEDSEESEDQEKPEPSRLEKLRIK